jgi:hypothetical protein
MHTLFVTPEKKESIRVTLRFHNVPGLNHSWTSAAAQAGQAFFGKRRKERDKCTAKSRIALWAVAVVIVICATWTVPNGASMKPSLSRPAVRIVFVLFFVRFYRCLTTTHLFGFGA